MKNNKLNKQKIIYIISIAITIFILIFLITTNIIGYGVKGSCESAQASYEGDCVESLIQYLGDEKNDFRTRNSAIWALGQIGDDRALPYLEELYTGEIPAKEPLDKAISQYELKKAINLTNGGMNLTSVFWRSLVD